MELLNECPVCEHDSFSFWMTCKDHTVSGESFTIDKCNSCGFLFTNPRPALADLGSYYKAEAYISHTDSSKGLINKLYKAARKFTLRNKFGLVKDVIKGRKLLDIGCGTGAFLNYCRTEGVDVLGIEPDPDARKIAFNNYQIESLPEAALKSLPASGFAVITMWHVLEHVPFLKERVREIRKLLSEDGRAFIAVPNHSAHDAVFYKIHWAAYDVPRHLHHFTPETIERLFRSEGFDLESTLPMKLDSYYVSLLSEKYKNGSTNFLNAFYQGARSNLLAGKNKWSSQIYVFRKRTAK